MKHTPSLPPSLPHHFECPQYPEHCQLFHYSHSTTVTAYEWLYCQWNGRLQTSYENKYIIQMTSNSLLIIFTPLKPASSLQVPTPASEVRLSNYRDTQLQVSTMSYTTPSETHPALNELTRTVTSKSNTFHGSFQKAEKLSIHFSRISTEKTMTVKASMKPRNSLSTTIPGWSDIGSSVCVCV